MVSAASLALTFSI